MAEMNTVAARRARFGANALLYTILVIAILAAINYLGVRFNKPLDLTSNKRYTLSQETQKIVGNLKQDAKITYFDSPLSFPQAKGLLDRYKNLSSKIHVEYVDYKKDPIRDKEYGLRFAGTAFVEEGSQREEAKSFDEQGITGAFLKLSKGIRKVCFASGSKEHSLDQTDGTGLSGFKGMLERDNYEPTSLALLEKSAIPEDCKVTVIAGPKADYTPNEVTALKNYVEGGGRVLFLLDPPLDFRSEHVADNAALTGLLESWGITLDKDLVLDESVIGPQIPLVSNYESHPVVNDLKGSYSLLPLVRSMEVKNVGKSTVSKLFSSTDKAVGQLDLTSGKLNVDDPRNKKGPFVLGAAGSYDTGNPEKPGRFVVIGTSGFLANEMIGSAVNRDLALNAVNWLSSDEDLISIRQKEPEDRRLDPKGPNVIQIFGLFVFPIAIILAGVLVYMKRR